MFKECIENLEDITQEEWELLHRYKIVLSDLLDDLKSKGKLKSLCKMPTNFPKLIETNRKFNRTYNMMLKIFDEKGKSKRFVENNKDEFGITEEDLPYLFISQVLSCFIFNMEFLRITMLEILKRDKFKETIPFRTLISKLSKISPEYGKKLEDEIDINLRNAVAHGTFWIDSRNLYYCDNMRLEKPISIELSKLLIEVKRHNIIAQCFLCLVTEKLKKTFYSRLEDMIG